MCNWVERDSQRVADLIVPDPRTQVFDGDLQHSAAVTILDPHTEWFEGDLRYGADVTIVDHQTKGFWAFDCKAFSNALRHKMRRLKPTGSVEFDRQRLLAVYQKSFWRREQPIATCDVDVFSSLCVPITLWEECVESSGFNPVIALFHFVSFIVDEIAQRCREAVKAKAKALAETIAINLRYRLRCGLRFKPLHTPLQLFPRSIHPSELSA